ncbi:MAG TPA: pyridoxal-phosphate dependent enzyme [Ktedonobacteraceae bacterium]|nr:pyridoxal-phosphate dependent enzyme [Ktedonobacteraceae bacterium]
MSIRAISGKDAKQGIEMYLQCVKCQEKTHIQQMLSACKQCNGPLEYVLEGNYDGTLLDHRSLWKNFAFLPLQNRQNIVSFEEGDSPIVELDELNEHLKGARLFVKLDYQKNPTGTFKDREASIIISRCKELQLDNLVFYSTGNTGRSYTHYAAHAGLTTYFFMPKECRYKNTAWIRKNKNNFIIFVDAHYPEISTYAKNFAAVNHLTAIAPLHDRTECYTTVAYEQYQQMPDCDFFVQTIASGMGAVGFVRGHCNLIKLGLEPANKMPRVVCVQSQETNAMYKAYTADKPFMTKDDLPAEFPVDLFEPTLNSTNPVNNYQDLRACLNTSHGLITDVAPQEVRKVSLPIITALEKRNIPLRVDVEKSILIGYAGLMRLADEGKIGKGDRVLLLGTGRGRDTSHEIIEPDLLVNLSQDDPLDVKRRLEELAR